MRAFPKRSPGLQLSGCDGISCVFQLRELARVLQSGIQRAAAVVDGGTRDVVRARDVLGRGRGVVVAGARPLGGYTHQLKEPRLSIVRVSARLTKKCQN